MAGYAAFDPVPEAAPSATTTSSLLAATPTTYLPPFFSPAFQLAPLTPATLTLPFTGPEFRYGRFVFRPALFPAEGLILLGILAYLFLGILGRRSNASRARNWLQAQLPLLKEQFAVAPGVEGLKKHGGSLYYAWYSGRRGLKGVNFQVVLKGRNDVISRVSELVLPLVQIGAKSVEDRVVAEIELSGESRGVQDDIVFAVVDKGAMRSLREDRWDLRIYTQTSESPHLPSSHAVMSEAADVTTHLLGSSGSIKETPQTALAQLAKKAPHSLQWLDSIIVSGEWLAAPDPEDVVKTGNLPSKTRHITVSFRLPPSGREAETLPILEAALSLVDLLSSKPVPFTTEGANKAKKRRLEALEVLTADARKEAKEEAEEKKRKEKKAIEDEKRKGMSAQQIREADEKKKRKDQRKAQGKMTKKVL